jgi:hypothetical protein
MPDVKTVLHEPPKMKRKFHSTDGYASSHPSQPQKRRSRSRRRQFDGWGNAAGEIMCLPANIIAPEIRILHIEKSGFTQIKTPPHKYKGSREFYGVLTTRDQTTTHRGNKLS